MKRNNPNNLPNLRNTLTNQRTTLTNVKVTNTNVKNNSNKGAKNRDPAREQRGTLVGQNNKTLNEINHPPKGNRNTFANNEEKRQYISNEEHVKNIDEIVDFFDNHLTLRFYKTSKKALKSPNIKTFYEI